MKQFSFKRFVNVARWDLSVNSKFYTRSAILMMAFISTPVVLYYLYNMLTKGFILHGNLVDNVQSFVLVICLIGIVYSIIPAGYMFHNLLTKQGRINELTLPATNLERFLWHAFVICIGVPIVFSGGVVLADAIHALFRLAISGADIQSISAAYFWGGGIDWRGDTPKNFIDFYDSYGLEVSCLIMLSMLCYFRSFSLVNAWKYRYNIPLTFLFYFILQTAFPLVLLFIGNLFISKDNFMDIVNSLMDINPHHVLISLNIFFALLYIGIWLLTYRLYTRAQLTTKRNP
ncbi:MAG: hypothetical protein IKQ37_11935 [Bacteroidaceae bacterium]|nr:hypothetical protein [Bacteroidaceae bacterium]